MRNFLTVLMVCCLVTGVLLWKDGEQPDRTMPPAVQKVPGGKQIPSDWFWMQRAYPQGKIPDQAVDNARIQAKTLVRKAKKNQPKWENLGPTLVGGRMTDIEILPDGSWWAGSATGGIFKTVDEGQTWTLVGDDTMSLSIGDIAYARSNPNVIYVGTGEANGGGGSTTYPGNGVFRSDDGGNTWTRRGLLSSKFIGRIAVHPQNPEWVYAAAMGDTFGPSEERGLYRSKDGGKTWERVLYVSDNTGAVDVAIDPVRPNRVFAAMWQRFRTTSNLFYGGPESGIHFSDDGGDTWTQVTNGVPGGNDIGRIGLAISESNPDIVYAQYFYGTTGFGGVHKSTDGGLSWQRTNDEETAPPYRNAGSWFGQVRVHPQDPDFVFSLGVLLFFSRDGGETWAEYSEYATAAELNDRVHVDMHGMAFDANHPHRILLANDGGIYTSENETLEFIPRNNFSNMQFYRCEFDPSQPQRLYGGTQDNGTWGTADSTQENWFFLLGGDGFQVEVDPTNSNSIYVEFQFGNLYHILNGTYIDGRGHLLDTDRANWDAPILIDPNNPQVVYHASQRLFRTDSGVENFVPISEDLTKGDGGGNRVFGTITAVDVARGNSQIIYVGTDDGNVQMTFDGGTTWHDRTAGLPQRWVRAVSVHPTDANTAFVALSGYRQQDYQPHVMKTTDAGETWVDISNNLPEAPVNDIIVDPENPARLYAASDFGVFYSVNGGDSWAVLGQDMPLVPVNDLDYEPNSKMLAAATYGRGMFRLDLTPIINAEAVLGTQLPERYVLPELRGHLVGETYIGIVNPNLSAANIEWFGFDSQGTMLEKSTMSMPIAARGKQFVTLGEAFPNSAADIDWVQIGSDLEVVVFAEIGDDQSRASYLAEKAIAGTVNIPHVARDTAQFQTFLASVNPHPAGLQTRIQPNGSGVSQQIPEHFSKYGRMARDVRDYFGEDLRDVAFAQLQDPLRGTATMEYFHRIPSRTQMAALGTDAQKGKTLRFLHVASDTANFWTGMVYIHVGTEPANISERFFGADGQLLESRQREAVPVDDKTTLLFDAENAQGLPAGTSWVEIISEDYLIGYDLFGANPGTGSDFFAGIKGSLQTMQRMVYPHFLAGENQWLGLVALNTGEVSADLQFQVFAADGSLLEEKTMLEVPANAKRTILVGDYFENEETLTKGAWILVNAAKPVWNGFLLWGDRNQGPRRNMSGMVAAPVP